PDLRVLANVSNEDDFVYALWHFSTSDPSAPAGKQQKSSFFRSDCPASGCADRLMSGRDFASPATSSTNHSRGNHL
ncbi:MAG: hypothetical protein WAK56_13325, partial [Candidatus Sulfotelmatobacter sp.]